MNQLACEQKKSSEFFGSFPTSYFCGIKILEGFNFHFCTDVTAGTGQTFRFQAGFAVPGFLDSICCTNTQSVGVSESTAGSGVSNSF